MNMMRLIVNNNQLVDFPDDDALDSTLESLVFPYRPFAQEVVFQIIVLKAGFNIATGINAMNVGEKEITGFTDNGNIILNMQGQLKSHPASFAPQNHCPAGQDL